MTKLYTVAEARRILGSLAEDLARLEQIEPRTFAEYMANWEKVAIVERVFTRLVNYAVDLNQFVLVSHNVQPPTNYFQTFTELARLKVLPQKLARDLARGTAVRNRLEHEYDRIDHVQVYTYVNKVPRWYRGYMRYIKQWLDAQEKPHVKPRPNRTRARRSRNTEVGE
jgi:uncharacterized protein YutE (UPF0331/DUF86 family)